MRFLLNVKLPPIHPGEILLKDFMKPLGLTASRLAKDIGVTPVTISQITSGRRAVTSRIAKLFAQRFGTSSEIWIKLQAQHDREVTFIKQRI